MLSQSFVLVTFFKARQRKLLMSLNSFATIQYYRNILGIYKIFIILAVFCVLICLIINNVCFFSPTRIIWIHLSLLSQVLRCKKVQIFQKIIWYLHSYVAKTCLLVQKKYFNPNPFFWQLYSGHFQDTKVIEFLWHKGFFFFLVHLWESAQT